MTITKTESGLTQDQYDALLESFGNSKFRLVLEKYANTWIAHLTQPQPDYWDAIAADDLVIFAAVRAGTLYVSTLASEDAGDQVWSAETTIDTDVTFVSLNYDGSFTTLYYYKDATTIKMVFAVGAGEPSGIPLTVASISNLVGLAATTEGRAHFAQLTDQSVPSTVHDPIFAGTGKNDMESGGSYTGSTMAVYQVTIYAKATPDTFTWSKDGGVESDPINCSTSAIVLSDGIEVTFGSTDETHEPGDRWRIIQVGEGGNIRLGVIDSGAIKYSDVWWPWAIDSFDAELIDGTEIIAIATDTPYLTTFTTTGTSVQSTLRRVSGIVIFSVIDSVWSQHEMWDIVDIPSDTTRYNLRLSQNGEYAFLAYAREDLTIGVMSTYKSMSSWQQRHYGLAVSRSSDGISWESPVVYSRFGTSGGKLVTRGNHAYLVSPESTYRSLRAAYDGVAETTLDVTDYVSGITTSVGQIRNTKIELDNPACVLIQPASLLGLGVAVQAKLYLGYYIDDLGVCMPLIMTGLLAGAARSPSRLPVEMLSLSIKDPLERMNIIASDNANEWQSLVVGADNYYDKTGTGYGGMGHTAVVGGRFMNGVGAETKRLLGVSSWKENVGWTTFLSGFNENGALQVAFELTGEDDEYAGIAFRASDKSNLWAALYYKETDKIHLVERFGVASTDAYYGAESKIDLQRAVSDVLGWSANPTKYMRVVWKYNTIRVFGSLDGITWTAIPMTGSGGTSEIYECWGCNNVSVNALPIAPRLSGHAGVISYGFSEVDTPIGPPKPPEPPEPPPEVYHGDGNIVAILLRESFLIGPTTYYRLRVCMTINFLDPTPFWFVVPATGLPSEDLNPNRLVPYSITFAEGGSNPRGLYISVGRYTGGEVPPDGDFSKVYYNSCPEDPLGSWSEVSIPAGYYMPYDNYGVGIYPPPLVQADPFESGNILINIAPAVANADYYVGFFVANDGAAVTTGAIAAKPYGLGHVLGWDEGQVNKLITLHYLNYMGWGFYYRHMLNIPITLSYTTATPDQEFSDNYRIGSDPISNNCPLWMSYWNVVSVPGMSRFATAENFGASYGWRAGWASLEASEASPSNLPQPNGPQAYLGLQTGRCAHALGKIAYTMGIGGGVGDDVVYLWDEGLTHALIPTFKSVGVVISCRVALFSANNDATEYIALMAQTAAGSSPFQSIRSCSTDGVTWIDRTGNLASLLSSGTSHNPGIANAITTFWGSESS